MLDDILMYGESLFANRLRRRLQVTDYRLPAQPNLFLTLCPYSAVEMPICAVLSPCLKYSLNAEHVCGALLVPQGRQQK